MSRWQPARTAALVIAVIGLFLAPAALFAQFRSGVQVVEVDVRVFDEDGRFVSTLTRDDFQLLEAGVPQQVQTLYLVGSDRPPAEPSATAAATARHTWIFMFDLNHLAPGPGINRARAAVEGFIRDRFSDGDLAGVVAGTRMVNNRLTSSREELIAAMRTVNLTAERHESADEIARASMETLTALNALASGLAKMPGPKTIVFLSDGFVIDQLETTLRTVAGQAATAGARIYAVDLRGLEQRQFDAQTDGPTSLAVDTGGLMIRNETNIARALETIAADANRYYVLGYQPTDANFDGTFRSIEVRVALRGVRVRARRGYIALEPSRMLVPQPVTSTAKVGANVTDVGSNVTDVGSNVTDVGATVTEVGPTVTDASPTVTEVGPNFSSGSITPRTTLPGTPGGVRLRPDAGKRIEELSRGEIGSADALAKQGWEAYQRGDVESAVGPLSEASTRSDVRPWVLYTLGLSQMALGRAHDAATSWERVRQAAPDFAPVYIDLADTYIQLSEVTKALAVLREAENRWPADPEPHNAVGVIHVRRGALDEAVEAFSKAAAAAPSEPLAYFNLGRAYELRFARGRRYVSSQRRWVAPDDDRRKAAEHYQRYLALGGPYATQAAEALNRLEWAKQ